MFVVSYPLCRAPQTAAMLQSIADHLETYGWAVCDGYVPIELVIEVRKELKAMEGHYTPGEIWVSAMQVGGGGAAVWWGGPARLHCGL